MSDRRRGTALTGSLIALVGTLSFAPITTLAKLSYDAGANGATLVLMRFLAALPVIWLLIQLRGRVPLLPRGAWGNALGAGLCWIGGTYGYLGAVEYIPVSLAAVAVYSFPLIVAALAPFTEGTRLTRLHGLAFLAAFAGLALALGPDLSTLDWRGLALAAWGALGSAGMLLLTARQKPEVDSMTHTFWVNIVGLAGILVLLPFAGGIALPGTSEGWQAFTAVLLIYILAILAVLAGSKLAGAARTAMIMNLEPVITLGLAALVLGEILGWPQITGAALVIGAVVTVTLLDIRRTTAPATPLTRPLPHSGRFAASRGSLAAFGAASAYAATTILAALIYRDGGNPQTLMVLRFAVTVLAVGLTALAIGRSFKVPGRLWPLLLVGGFGLTAMSTGYVASVAFIPVQLATLIFYLFPLLVVAALFLLDRQPPRPLALLAYLLAFGGLALALGPDFSSLDWRGLALALGGALGAVIMFLGTRQLTSRLDGSVATTLLAAIALLFSLAVMAGTEGLRLPASGGGRWMLAAIIACFILALVLHVEAIRSAGPARAAMIFNVEPAITILAAALLLGESLGLLQLGGVALVLAALVLSALPARPARITPAESA